MEPVHFEPDWSPDGSMARSPTFPRVFISDVVEPSTSGLGTFRGPEARRGRRSAQAETLLGYPRGSLFGAGFILGCSRSASLIPRCGLGPAPSATTGGSAASGGDVIGSVEPYCESSRSCHNPQAA